MKPGTTPAGRVVVSSELAFSGTGDQRLGGDAGEETAIRRTHITRVISGSDRSASHVEDGRLAPLLAGDRAVPRRERGAADSDR
jgi:hypothetical protein